MMPRTARSRGPRPMGETLLVDVVSQCHSLSVPTGAARISSRIAALGSPICPTGCADHHFGCTALFTLNFSPLSSRTIRASSNWISPGYCFVRESLRQGEHPERSLDEEER